MSSTPGSSTAKQPEKPQKIDKKVSKGPPAKGKAGSTPSGASDGKSHPQVTTHGTDGGSLKAKGATTNTPPAAATSADAKSSSPGIPGHLFVLWGDPRLLSCDAWMLPWFDGWVNPKWSDLAIAAYDGEEFESGQVRILPTRDSGLSVDRKEKIGSSRVVQDTDNDAKTPTDSIDTKESDDQSNTVQTNAKTLKKTEFLPLPVKPNSAYLVNTSPRSAQNIPDEADGAEADQKAYFQGAVNFISAFQQALASNPGYSPSNKRCCPLVLIPIGCGDDASEMSPRSPGVASAVQNAGTLLSKIQEMVDSTGLGFDVGIITTNERTYSVLQAIRRRRMDRDGPLSIWGSLQEGLATRESATSLIAEGVRLARLAEADQLVMFLGSGVSMGAGLPNWGGLINGLAERAGLDEKERLGLKKYQFLEQARLLASRLGESFAMEIASKCTSKTHSLQHTLLGQIPASGYVTTNYDELFEMACFGQNCPVRTIPAKRRYAPPQSQSSGTQRRKRWLLKLHGMCQLARIIIFWFINSVFFSLPSGDVETPRSIVLSREHYVGYEDERSALLSVVQMLLMTQHMCFIGFSLTDYNFHKIMFAVQQMRDGPSTTRSTTTKQSPRRDIVGRVAANIEKATRKLGRPTTSGTRPKKQSSTWTRNRRQQRRGSWRDSGPTGSAIMVVAEKLKAEMWRGQVHTIDIMPEPTSRPRWTQYKPAGRKLEIFLDFVGCRGNTSRSSYLLDPSFESLLTPKECAFANFFKSMVLGYPSGAKKTTAYLKIWNLAKELGVEVGAEPPEITPRRKFKKKRSDRKIKKDSKRNEEDVQTVDIQSPRTGVLGWLFSGRKKTKKTKKTGPTSTGQGRDNSDGSSSDENPETKDLPAENSLLMLQLHKSASQTNLDDVPNTSDGKATPLRRPQGESGHLFVVRGDIRPIGCDVILLPSQSAQCPYTTTYWLQGVMTASKARQLHSDALLCALDPWVDTRRAFGDDAMSYTHPCVPPGCRKRQMSPVGRLNAWPKDKGAAFIGLSNSAFLRDQSQRPKVVVATLQQFLQRAADYIRSSKQPPLNGRHKHLVAVPAIGTGFSGGFQSTGSFIQAIVATLRQGARHYNFDVALVCWDKLSYSQAQRDRLKATAGETWPDLTPFMCSEARRIAFGLRTGSMSLVVSSVDASSMTPSLPAMLKRVAEELKLSPRHMKELQTLTPADAAAVLLRRVNGNRNRFGLMLSKAAQALERRRSIYYYLLAQLPAAEVVTDEIHTTLQAARHSIGRPLMELQDRMKASSVPGPDENGKTARVMKSSSKEWILYLNGSVASPRRLAVTRADAARKRQHTLRSVVEALLITKEIVFCGCAPHSELVQKSLEATGAAAHARKDKRRNPRAPEGVFWSWRDYSGWKRYDPITSDAIESAYQRGERSCKLRAGEYFVANPFYTVEFAAKSFRQVNVRSGFRRNVRRHHGKSVAYKRAQAKRTRKNKELPRSTLLTATDNQLASEGLDARVVSMARHMYDGDSKDDMSLDGVSPGASRRLDVFLDLVGALVSNCSLSLMDPRFSSALSSPEEAFKKHTLACLHSIGVALSREYPASKSDFPSRKDAEMIRSTRGFTKLMALLRRCGLKSHRVHGQKASDFFPLASRK